MHFNYSATVWWRPVCEAGLQLCLKNQIHPTLQQRLGAEFRANQRSVEKTESPFKCSHILAGLTLTLTVQ